MLEPLTMIGVGPYTQRSMVKRKTPLIISGFWQIIRFIVLVVCSTLYLNPMAYAGVSLLVVLLAAPSLVLAMFCFFAGFYHSKFTALRGFLIFGKTFEVLPSLFILILQSGALYFGIGRPVFDKFVLLDKIAGHAIETGYMFLYGIAGIVLLDLIFLLILLSYGTEPDSPDPRRGSTPGENLPEYTITEIEEE